MVVGVFDNLGRELLVLTVPHDDTGVNPPGETLPQAAGTPSQELLDIPTA